MVLGIIGPGTHFNDLGHLAQLDPDNGPIWAHWPYWAQDPFGSIGPGTVRHMIWAHWPNWACELCGIGPIGLGTPLGPLAQLDPGHMWSNGSIDPIGPMTHAGPLAHLGQGPYIYL